MSEWVSERERDRDREMLFKESDIRCLKREGREREYKKGWLRERERRDI